MKFGFQPIFLFKIHSIMLVVHAKLILHFEILLD
jgi:hypothetical protein